MHINTLVETRTYQIHYVLCWPFKLTSKELLVNKNLFDRSEKAH